MDVWFALFSIGVIALGLGVYVFSSLAAERRWDEYCHRQRHLRSAAITAAVAEIRAERHRCFAMWRPGDPLPEPLDIPKMLNEKYAEYGVDITLWEQEAQQ